MSCCNNLFEQMACLRDQALAKICQPSGNPFLRSLILRTYSYDTENYSYEEISPTPYVDEDPQMPTMDAGVTNVKGSGMRFKANVSRQYTESQLRNQVADFIIDGVLLDLESGDRYSGILCELEAIDDKITFWELTLVEKIPEQSFTLV